MQLTSVIFTQDVHVPGKPSISTTSFSVGGHADAITVLPNGHVLLSKKDAAGVECQTIVSGSLIREGKPIAAIVSGTKK